jgi:hypothetical protein
MYRNKYLVHIEERGENKLLEYGNIIFKSILIKGFYGIESQYDIDYLQSLAFIKSIEKDREGSLDV